MAFQAILELHGATATGIEVPVAEVEALGAGKRVKVVVTLNGFSYRTSIAPMSGSYFIPVSAERRELAGVKAGDQVSVSLEIDTEPREVAIPPDFAEALGQHPGAQEKFEKLSYSHKLQHVLAIEGAKAAETRERRIKKALEILLGN
jgi:hypothetical protein